MENVLKIFYSDELSDITRNHPKLSILNNIYDAKPKPLTVIIYFNSY